MTPKLKITQTNKQADFKPESKNLMLSLVLFTLFPSLEMTSTLNNALRQHGADENDDKAAEPQIKHQTTILLIAVFKPEPKNLMLSLVLFTLFPSLERRQRRRRRRMRRGERRGDDENDDEAAEDLLFSAFSKTQKDLLCCHEQG